MSKDKHDLSRREFLKRLGLTSAVAMVELSPLSAITKKPVEPVEPTGNNMMTYRVNRNTGDKISLLGYGMMRLPFKERQIDQELVNEEVKYALEHGVNYFDTLPPTEDTAPDFKEKQAAFVAGFGKTLKLSELASACTGCRQCLSKCPQRIRIPNQLSRLVDLIEKGNPEAEF